MAKTKRVTDIIIAKDVSSGDGFIRVLNDQMSALTAGQTIADSPVIYLEQTIAGSKVRLSQPIHGAYVRKWSGQSASDAVKQVITVDNITAISSQEFGLFIHYTSDKDLSQGSRRYYVSYVTDSTGTAAEIAAGFVAAINAASFPLPITASTGGTDIILTADNVGDYFTVGRAIGFDSGTTIVETTAMDPGIGTYDQIYALEDIAKGYEGYLGERRTFMGNIGGRSTPTYYATGTANSTTSVYDIYVIDHDHPLQMTVPSDVEAKPLTTYICVPKAPSTFSQANFQSIINPWMASTPGAFAAVAL